jgi:hypothetical protein
MRIWQGEFVAVAASDDPVMVSFGIRIRRAPTLIDYPLRASFSTGRRARAARPGLVRRGGVVYHPVVLVVPGRRCFGSRTSQGRNDGCRRF